MSYRGRVEDTLQLMRKPLDTRMDATVGREVALRDGKIRALIAGRVDKIGGAYSMTAWILRSDDGSIAASVNEASMAQSISCVASADWPPAFADNWVKRCRKSRQRASHSRRWPRNPFELCSSTRRRGP